MMPIRNHIISSALLFLSISGNSFAQPAEPSLDFEFLGKPVSLPLDPHFSIPFTGSLTPDALQQFATTAEQTRYQPLLQTLLNLKASEKLDDWLYYQLIRRTAQAISPKADNYYRYTLYKWFLLSRSGYDATLKISEDKILFYVRSEENIYNIPAYTKDGKTYVCLNYHDYGYNIDFSRFRFLEAGMGEPAGTRPFSYRVSHIPDFSSSSYQEKDLQFSYHNNAYQFRVKLNPQIRSLFANYPVLDYAAYFNIPMSRETYGSLIPLLKKNIAGMNVKNGVDYLMRFTRYAFLFKTDQEHFGQEKRLTPEQTLLFDESDCEDRAALFFYLVKELYDLPMIVLAYPQHVTVAVRFDKPMGKSILYNGIPYTICEPTPQKKDLPIGKLLPEIRRQSYEVVYAYQPAGR